MQQFFIAQQKRAAPAGHFREQLLQEACPFNKILKAAASKQVSPFFCIFHQHIASSMQGETNRRILGLSSMPCLVDISNLASSFESRVLIFCVLTTSFSSLFVFVEHVSLETFSLAHDSLKQSPHFLLDSFYYQDSFILTQLASMRQYQQCNLRLAML